MPSSTNLSRDITRTDKVSVHYPIHTMKHTGRQAHHVPVGRRGDRREKKREKAGRKKEGRFSGQEGWDMRQERQGGRVGVGGEVPWVG